MTRSVWKESWYSSVEELLFEVISIKLGQQPVELLFFPFLGAMLAENLSQPPDEVTVCHTSLVKSFEQRP
jgi:hypothetical protein